DANELRAILRASLDLDGPLYVRMGRGRDPEVYPTVPQDFAFGRAIRLVDGDDVTMLATGSEVFACLEAAELLSAQGVSARVVDMHTLTPVDAGEIAAAVEETSAVMTVEEHNVTGGLGAAVAEVLADMGAPVRFRRAGVPDEHVVIGPPAALYARYGLDGAGVAVRALDLLGAADPGLPPRAR
ncbi:MAG TPA: transketolase C-terminal domain-containing protein, partial [Acidimicrobiales bacterium]|nr:transketolase C-terminal domain-containing protein [Acidimicrobiales bacterium]